MAKKRDLMISTGLLQEDDGSWDIAFWQSVSTEERFRAAGELIRNAYRAKHGTELVFSVNRKQVEHGSYLDDREQ